MHFPVHCQPNSDLCYRGVIIAVGLLLLQVMEPPTEDREMLFFLSQLLFSHHHL